MKAITKSMPQAMPRASGGWSFCKYLQATFCALCGVMALLAALGGCGSPGGQGDGHNHAGGQGATAQSQYSGKGPIQATATIGMITDIVSEVGGERVQVQGMMGPGIDPHLYKATPGDIQKMDGADIVFYNGLHLEGKMGDVLERMGQRKPVIAVGDSIDPKLLRRPTAFQGHPDPHVWFDVSMWMSAVESVRDSLSKFDPPHKAEYDKRSAAYLTKLKELHAYAKTQLATVPKAGRVLVTAHDAFGYFGRAYDVEVEGLQGISTASEYSVKDVQRLVKMLSERKIKAVFVESSVPRRSVEAVVQGCRARGHQVKIGGELFSDAMGKAGTPEGTYIGMVRHNVDLIARSLK